MRGLGVKCDVCGASDVGDRPSRDAKYAEWGPFDDGWFLLKSFSHGDTPKHQAFDLCSLSCLGKHVNAMKKAA